ncbi:MAG: 50S ribosomal protein L25/general stress protein Ctc [Tepidanaerobacteraceae bacterium]|nr:50S ribosomal protein L25/general stress protein Ctc [Tepidanaerobacteraceae bacterium]
MEHPTLRATNRQATGKCGIKRLRRENKLPAVVYGKGFETTSVVIDEKEASKIFKTRGTSSLINLELDSNTFPVLTKEVQWNALKNSIDHVDFFKVSMDEEVEYNLSIFLTGDSEGVKEGGTLQHQLREVTVKALPGDMLDNVEVDISSMVIGDTITVADLKVNEKNTILNDPDEVVVTLLAPRAEEEEEDIEVPEEGEEPELVQNDKEEEE